MDESILAPVSDFSDPWSIVMTVLFNCSASLSLIGSFTILFKILRDRGSTTPYDRIICGLSSGDIVASITYAMAIILWANASPACCRAYGVLFHLSCWSVWYNGLLSFYFLVTVLSQIRRKDFVRKWEPWMHLSGIFFPITAIISYRRRWWDVNDLGTACEFDPICFLVLGIPFTVSFLSMIVNYSIIYTVIRKSLRSSNEWSENVSHPTLVQKRLKQEATTMMMLYVGCFLVTWLPFFVVMIFGKYLGETFLYFVLVLNAIFLPLQGFFNVFIYLKPAYTRFRAANPNQPMHFVLHQALFNPKIPQLNYSSDQSTSNAIAEGDAGISGFNFESNLHFKEDEPDLHSEEDAKENENSSNSSA